MSQLPAVFIDGVIYASWVFLVAVGLTLIYGVMKILNLAHGSLYAIGAYAAASLTGAWLAHGYPAWTSYLVLVLAAILAGLVTGPLIERGVLRFMYGRDEVVQLLATYAVFLIFEDVVKLIWGTNSYFLAAPYALMGNVGAGDLVYPVYDVALIVVAAVIALGLTWALQHTRTGKLLRVVIHDREVSLAMGINVRRFYLVTFTVGAMLAALGGALTAPMQSVHAGMGVDVIVLAFAVVVIGGLGSLPGAVVGALIVGLVHSAATHYLPQSELFSIYLAMTLVLLFRPQGLFVGAKVRKI